MGQVGEDFGALVVVYDVYGRTYNFEDDGTCDLTVAYASC